MISFLWSEWGVEWVCQTLWHCVSEGTACCCWMNTTPWKQNGFSLHRGCCSLDCDFLRCWINRWIRLWKEMICWFCRLFLLSSDNLSVGEESCESIIPWFLDPNSFVVTPISLTSPRVRVSQLQSSPLLFILIKSNSIHCLVSINSTHSDSSQWSLFYRIHPISTLVSLLFTIQWSILMYNPTPKSIIQLLSETILFHSVFSISVLLWVSNPKGHLKQTLCWNAHISVITSYMNVSLCCSYKEGCLLSYKIIN